MKALVRERVDDWKVRLERKLGRRVVELTGDSTPDIRAIERADVIVTTPEKWDGISRSWQNRFAEPVGKNRADRDRNVEFNFCLIALNVYCMVRSDIVFKH